MTRITTITKCFTAAVVAAAALAGTSNAGALPATSGGGSPQPIGLSAGSGCSISCVTSAIVTPTASSASVRVVTDVPTSVAVVVTKLDQQLGLTTGVQPKPKVLATFQTVRTVVFTGLEAETRYRIAVTARDRAGHKEIRTGTFKTRAVKVAVDLPDIGLSAGLGCKADCIASGTAVAHATEVGRVDFDVRLTEPGRVQLDLYLSNGHGGLTLQRSIASSNGTRTFTPSAEGLVAGVTYTVRVKATDAANHSRVEWGTFRTARAVAVVTFHKITVISDGEVGDGEIAFGYSVENDSAGGNGFHKIGAGDTVAAVAYGTSRPTVTIRASIDGHRNLDVAVQGVECDGSLMKNCVIETGHNENGEYGDDTYVDATAAFDLYGLLTGGGALPPGYGTGLPAGHDGYLIWEKTGYELAFRVYATVDFEIVA
jgi:hypothetical protein